MIKIINNFFEENMFKEITSYIKNNLFFTPRYFEDSKKKTNENFYGNRFCLNKDENLLNTFIKQSEKKFHFKIKKVHHDCGIDLRNLSKFQPHVDNIEGIQLNILIMLEGPIGVTTGTVFYTDKELDIHVGFRPNRAVLFPSNYYHCAHKCDLENLKRYTASLFIQEYEL